MHKILALGIGLLLGSSCGSGLDPNGLKFLVTFQSPASPSGAVVSLASSGNTLFAASNEGIQIYDVANGTDAKKLADFRPAIADGTAIVSFVSVRDTTLYYEDQNGLEIADISTPAAPVFIKKLSGYDRSAIRSANVKGRTLVAGLGYGTTVNLWNSTDPRNPTMVATFHTSAELGALTHAVTDDHTVYVSGLNGLEIYDVTAPTATTKLGSLLNGDPGDLFLVEKGYLYCTPGELAGYPPGRSIIDVRDPSHLQYTEQALTGGNQAWAGAASFARQGDYVYLIHNQYSLLPGLAEGVRAYDVREPLAPKNVATTLSADGAVGIAQILADDRFVYVAHSKGVTLFGPK